MTQPNQSEPIGCAEREVGRYIYKLIEARMNAKPGTPESAELAYLARIVSDVEEYGADELEVADIANEPAFATREEVSAARATTPDRETVARVIDPEAFVSLDDHRAWAAGFVARHRLGSDGLEDIARSNYSAREPGRVAALAKADAILALWPTGEGVSGGVVDVGGLVEALTHAISICPSLDTNGYITEKSEAIKAVKAALRGRGEGGAGEDQGAAGTPSAGGEG